MDTKLSLPTDKKDSRLISSKLVAVTAVVLGLAAIAGLSAVVAVTLPMAYYNSEASSLRQELENKEKMHSKVLEDHIAKRQANPNYGASCHSEMGNDTESIPIARIEGRGTRWGTVAPTAPTGYVTKWKCSGTGFVEGGMNFTQDDQTLVFPKCGYYYISSQVLFQYTASNNDPTKTDLSAQHGIEIIPNCEPYIHSRQYRYGHSSMVQNNFVRTSTYVGDVVKMCEGGTIRVFIPISRTYCCANGDGGRTHFSAFLIEETDCE